MQAWSELRCGPYSPGSGRQEPSRQPSTAHLRLRRRLSCEFPVGHGQPRPRQPGDAAQHHHAGHPCCTPRHLAPDKPIGCWGPTAARPTRQLRSPDHTMSATCDALQQGSCTAVLQRADQCLERHSYHGPGSSSSPAGASLSAEGLSASRAKKKGERTPRSLRKSGCLCRATKQQRENSGTANSRTAGGSTC